MSRREDLHPRLAALSVSLARETAEEHDAVVELEKLLVRSRIDEPSALTPRALSVERGRRGSLPRPLRPRADRTWTGWTIGRRSAAFRVFRRETPISAPMLDLATPSWGRGALAQHSVGPLRGVDGRLFWFDFFPLVKLVPLYFAGDPQPAILFFERPHTALSRPGTTHPGEVQHLDPRESAGAHGAAADTLASGSTAAPSRSARTRERRHQIHHGGRVDLQRSVEAVAESCCRRCRRPGWTGCGRCATDHARRLLVQLWRRGRRRRPTSRGGGNGLRRRSCIRGAGCGRYVRAVAAIGRDPDARRRKLSRADRQSPFATRLGARIFSAPAGRCRSRSSTPTPTEAAGSGGLAIRTGAGLELAWSGLREGPSCCRTHGSGRAGTDGGSGSRGLQPVCTPAAAPVEGRRFRFRSEAELRYTNSFPVWYATAATGNELLLAQTNVEAKLDRPVDVKGTPFPVRTLKSLLSLAYTDDKQFAFLYDDNILVDSLDPAGHGRDRRRIHDLVGHSQRAVHDHAGQQPAAVRRACRRGDRLQGDPVPRSGLIRIVAHAARSLRRQHHVAAPADGREPTGRAAGMLLVGAVAWTKAADETTRPRCRRALRLRRLATQQTIAQWTEAGDRQRELTAALSHDDATRARRCRRRSRTRLRCRTRSTGIGCSRSSTPSSSRCWTCHQTPIRWA